MRRIGGNPRVEISESCFPLEGSFFEGPRGPENRASAYTDEERLEVSAHMIKGYRYKNGNHPGEGTTF